MLARSLSAVAAPRKPASPAVVQLRLKMLRPSLLDQRFSGDAWIVDRGEGSMAVCLGNYPVSWLEELSLDLPSLNRLFLSLRRLQARRPRSRKGRLRCRKYAAVAD
jgi:hypothetical protein